ncbi:MAG: hypothetical protein GY749_13415 [Desulfobacteraceae bacterium]|nr:hypothetical protein [Desulfobacteraceae bacterium]
MKWSAEDFNNETLIIVGEKHDILPQTLTLACELNDSHYEEIQETDFIKFKSYYMGMLILPLMFMMQILIVFPIFKNFYSEAAGQMPGFTLSVTDKRSPG